MRLFKNICIAALLAVLSKTFSIPEAFALAEKDDAVPQFAIKHFTLEGNTLLDPLQVQKMLAPYTGPQRDFGDIQQAMEVLEKGYRDLGYTMVTVILPEQELARGEVRIQAIEPRITAINIDGNNHFSRENILQSLPTLKTGATPLVNAISENLRAANENPARKMSLQTIYLSGVDGQLFISDQLPCNGNCCTKTCR